MDFFEQQDRARRKTTQLTILFLVATVAIVAAVTVIVAVVFASLDTRHGGITLPSLEWVSENKPLLAWSGLATLVFIGAASLYRLTSLRSGGGVVARELGGSVVHVENEDPLLRRLYNVVEEMAIASGVPVPEVYVLEQEAGINAFAAGYTPTDAAVAVTRGTLERLNRQELQGVIAHEFSHILNGDMRLNSRLMGMIFGIIAIGMIGRTILHGARYSGTRRSSRNGDGGVAPILLAGLALFIIGYLGVLFGRIIRSAISRQREFLADASAVQFTRETEGIAQALKKIGGYTQRSYLQSARAEEIGHMLFALGGRSFASLFATHPPLEERIKALDANFDPSEYAKRAGISDPMERGPVAGFSSETPEIEPAASVICDTDSLVLDPRQFSNSAASPRSEHLRYAKRLRDSLPDKVLESVHSFSRSSALIIALVLDRAERIRRRQLAIVQQQMGASFVGLAEELFKELQRLSPAYRLPLLDMAFPALKRRPLGHLQFVEQLVEKMIVIDGKIDEFEYMLGKVFSSHLQDLEQPDRRIGDQTWDNPGMMAAAQSVLSLVAKIGHRSEDEAKQAYRAGLQMVVDNGLGAPLADGQFPYAPPSPWLAGTDKALAQLDGLSGEAKGQLLDALTMAIRHDERVTLKEAELLRGICATLRVPVPPCVIQIF